MRKPRVLREGARYHVSARINRKEMILESREIKELFLSVLRRAKLRYVFRIENFCVMNNHIHLLILPGPGENLSSIMQWILSVFAMAFNRRRGFTGHVWGERFFSRVLERLKAFLEAFEYIDANPVKAHLVEDPREWPWGGFWYYWTGYLGVLDKIPYWLLRLLPERDRMLLRDS